MTWKNESQRHRSARYGYKTGRKSTKQIPLEIPPSKSPISQDFDKSSTYNMKSYNGYPLIYVATGVAFDDLGEDTIGMINYGRDADGKICVQDGKFIRTTRSSDGYPLHIYETHSGLISLKRGPYGIIRI